MIELASFLFTNCTRHFTNGKELIVVQKLAAAGTNYWATEVFDDMFHLSSTTHCAVECLLDVLSATIPSTLCPPIL